LELIFDLIGTPNKEEIDKLSQTENTKNFLSSLVEKPKRNFAEVFGFEDLKALDLLKKMLEFDPDKRMSVNEALKHEYFKDFVGVPEDEVIFAIYSLSQ
jgi:serine/threonine protein kinase